MNCVSVDVGGCCPEPGAVRNDYGLYVGNFAGFFGVTGNQ